MKDLFLEKFADDIIKMFSLEYLGENAKTYLLAVLDIVLTKGKIVGLERIGNIDTMLPEEVKQSD